jgi:8-oxo-dGTP pyrophosphatase MutT (NUDIX family)
MIFNKKKLIKSWKKNFKASGSKIKKVSFIKYIERKNKKIILAFADSIIFTKNKKKISRAVQIEWPSVIIVPVLIYKNDIKTLLIEQFRVGSGKYTLDFPAGIIEDKNIRDSAIREIKEELNISITKQKLKILNKKPVYMLPASNTQLAHFFYFKINVSRSFLKSINNSDSGCANEGEYLKIKVMSFKEIENINTSSVIIGLSLIKKII